MCGLVGWVDPSPASREVLQRMCDAIAHRGPDADGFHLDGEAALGHRRLAVIDLEASRQPMRTADGRFVLAYNGELYNFQELRKELETAGCRFQTAGDTEVVNTFSLARLIADRRFRRNIESEELSVTGVSGMYSRLLLDRPQGLRVTTVLNGEAGTGTFQYARASVEGTITRPVSRFSTALTGAIGSSVGDVPRQRGWFVGGVRTVRGQIAGTQDGDVFWLARGEVGTKQGVFRPVGFFDVGWAGSRNAFGKVQPQRGAGVGIGVLDGLIRVDFSRGLYPLKRWRTDFYVSAAL